LNGGGRERAMNPRGPDLIEVSLVALILALIVFRLTQA
jgi:hypothetical protein